MKTITQTTGFEKVLSALSFEPTEEQKNILGKMYLFVDKTNHDVDCFILKGAAGTGKTSIVKGIIDYMTDIKQSFALLASTNKAGYVLGLKTNQQVRTIHKTIYQHLIKENNQIELRFSQKYNDVPMVFFVDESSLISDQVNKEDNDLFISSTPLLSDFIKFVKTANPKNKIVFIGDEFQLPPVKCDSSPALSTKYLSDKFKLRILEGTLTEVKRQNNSSDLFNSISTVKNNLEYKMNQRFNLKLYRDYNDFKSQFIQCLTGKKFSSIVICHKNEDVKRINYEIHNQLFGSKNQIIENDEIYYFQESYYSPEDRVHIPKGENFIIKEIESITVCEDLKFADVKIELYKSLISTGESISLKINLDSLNTHDGRLPSEIEKRLINNAYKMNPAYRATKEKSTDVFLSAARISYSYAITCHKAQGSEWDYVFLFPSFSYSDHKWIYTALTRAKLDIFTFRLNKSYSWRQF